MIQTFFFFFFWKYLSLSKTYNKAFPSNKLKNRSTIEKGLLFSLSQSIWSIFLFLLFYFFLGKTVLIYKCVNPSLDLLKTTVCNALKLGFKIRPLQCSEIWWISYPYSEFQQRKTTLQCTNNFSLFGRLHRDEQFISSFIS